MLPPRQAGRQTIEKTTEIHQRWSKLKEDKKKLAGEISCLCLTVERGWVTDRQQPEETRELQQRDGHLQVKR